MANVKITELTADTNPASNDVLPIVDVDAAGGAGETKKVTIADLLENAGSGNAGAAAFAFDDDPDTGMYRTGANALGFTTGGTGRLFINSNGHAGIGTSSPDRLVHIFKGEAGTAPSDSNTALMIENSTHAIIQMASPNNFSNRILFGDPQDADAGKFLYDHSNNSLQFYVNASERVRITSSGALGLGTSAPSTALHINSTNNFTIATTNQTNAANSYISFVDTGTTAGQVRCGSQGNDFVVNAGGIRGMTIAASGTVTFPGQTLIGSNTAGASKVRIDPTGFVNIQSNASAGEALKIFDNSSTQKITLKADGTGSFAGNLGVGTTSPSSDLDVFNTGFVNLKIRSSGTNTAALNLTNSTRNYSINSSGGAFTIFDATASSERLRLDSSGRLLIGTSTSPTGGDAHAQNAPLLIQGRVGSDADSGRINLQRGSAASADSSIGTISFTDSSNNAYARISVEADAATGTDDYPGRIKFQTTENGQPGPPSTRLTIKNDGNVGVGTVNPPRSLTNANSVTLTTGTAPQYRLNATAADGADDDRAVFGLATSNSHFVSNAVPGDAVLRTTNGGNLLFGEGTTETMRITSAGQMRLAGRGITFNGDTATANELDDYEEGTFTPVLVFGNNTTGIVYNGRAGFYVKVGKVVHAWVYINLSSKGTANGAAAISQFPFTSEDINVSGLGNWPGAQPSRRQNQTSSNLALTMVDNSINCAVTDGAGVSATESSFTNGTILEFAICYRAA